MIIDLLKSKFLNRGVLVTFLRISIGLVFFFSGTIKLLDIPEFQISINRFNLISNNIVPVLAYLLVFVEMVLGTLLILKIKPIVTSNSLCFLLTIFTAVISSKIINGESLTCGCFGNIFNNKIDLLTVFRNITLILLLILLSSYYNKKENQVEENKNTEKNINRIYNTLSKHMVNLILIYLFFFISTQSIILSQQNRELKERLRIISEKKSI